jgi:hypothetical protein
MPRALDIVKEWQGDSERNIASSRSTDASVGGGVV